MKSGTRVLLSSGHVDSYLDEFGWRLNQLDNQYLFRDIILRLLVSPKMEFKVLVDESV